MKGPFNAKNTYVNSYKSSVKTITDECFKRKSLNQKLQVWGNTHSATARTGAGVATGGVVEVGVLAGWAYKIIAYIRWTYKKKT